MEKAEKTDEIFLTSVFSAFYAFNPYTAIDVPLRRLYCR